MSTFEPAEERIVDNLHAALARLKDDVARVELWAGALSSFSKPIPNYDPKQHQFALPPAAPPKPHRAP